MTNYILKNENAVLYECGFSCDNVLFVRLGSEAFFITDARYTIEAKEKAKNCEVLQASNLTKATRELLRVNRIQKVFFDPNDFSYLDYTELTTKLSTIFTPKKDFSKHKRIFKTSSEIELISKACALGRDAFVAFGEFICANGANLSEQQLYQKAKMFLSYDGAYELSFDPIVAINENAAKPHARPQNNSFLKSEDLLLVDAGLKYEGYCSDRTVSVGGVFDRLDMANREQKFSSSLHQKVYDIVLKAQQKAISQARSGMRGWEIDKIARDVIEESGYGKYFVHSTGHGVGLDIHEFPVISAKSQSVIEDGMVFTIEPGIYLGGEFGVRIEDVVVMENSKAKIL